MQWFENVDREKTTIKANRTGSKLLEQRVQFSENKILFKIDY